jgi:hypothetical protein
MVLRTSLPLRHPPKFLFLKPIPLGKKPFLKNKSEELQAIESHPWFGTRIFPLVLDWGVTKEV